MCDTLTREIIAQKNHGNWLILTWVSENAATSAQVSPYKLMSRKTLSGWGFDPDPDWGLISPQTPSFLEGGRRGKGEGERREEEGRGGKGMRGDGRRNLCSCRFSLKYALAMSQTRDLSLRVRRLNYGTSKPHLEYWPTIDLILLALKEEIASAVTKC